MSAMWSGAAPVRSGSSITNSVAVANKSCLLPKYRITSAASTPTSAAMARSVVRSNPSVANRRRAAARMSARVWPASRGLFATIFNSMSAGVDLVPFRRVLSKSSIVDKSHHLLNLGLIRAGGPMTCGIRRPSAATPLAEVGDAARPRRSDLLHRTAPLAIAAPRRTIASAGLVMMAAAIFGIPVAQSLSARGFADPASESARATALLTDKFGQGDVQLLFVVSAPDGATSPSARAVGTEIADQLGHSAHVTSVTSAWTAPPAAAASLISKDNRSGLIVAGIGGGEAGAQQYADSLSRQFAHDRNGVSVRSGGLAMVNAQITDQAQRDVLLMEAIAIPLSFLVLVWVFGGLLAAALPVAIGAMSILGSLAVLRLITLSTDVSIFALNLTTALGLALAIDYTLLIVSRFRDEIAGGASRDDALVHTMATAGRTVLFSATTVALSMAAMILFPMHFLKSFGYAGIATVAFTAIAAVVMTPAAIVLLGDRLNALDVRRLGRRLLGRPEPVAMPVERQFWYRSTTFVMRRALPVGLVVVALLLLVGLPFLGVRWGFPD